MLRHLKLAIATILATVAGSGAVVADPGAMPSGVGTAAPAGSVDLRVLYWNIFLGGTGTGSDNLPKLLDQVVSVAPDVFVVIETYGAGEDIRKTLDTRVGKGMYQAAQITPGHGIYKDNLWIFTRYPIVASYPKPTSRAISAFNFGGVRIRLPNGREVNVFDTWLAYDEPWIGDMIERNVADRRDSKRPTYSARKVRKSEATGLADIQGVLQSLPVMLGGNTDPIILAGDFNTVAASDWSSAWSECPSHDGQHFALRTTAQMTDAGFVDTYRMVHPDACTHPGGTWSPHLRLKVPQRIDFIWTKGNGITAVDAQLLDQRLPEHRVGPFYSDHAALVTDLRIDAE